MGNEAYVEGLERELAGYQLHGRKDRAAEVKKEIARAKGKDFNSPRETEDFIRNAGAEEPSQEEEEPDEEETSDGALETITAPAPETAVPPKPRKKR